MTTGLYVERVGEGPPVVLLHGLGASGRYWQRVMPLLRDTRSVVVPDLLGFGRSPKPQDSRYDIDAHLAALGPLVPQGATVVGHSVGAALAAALAARTPELVGGLVLVGLPAYPSEEIARAEVGRLGLLARLTVEESIWGRIFCEMMCAFRPLAIAVGPLLVRDLPREIVRDGARHTWTSYSRTLRRVVVEHRVLPDLRSLDALTVLHGRSDNEAPLGHLEDALSEVREHGTNAELVILDGDHHLPVREPAAVAAAVLRRSET